MTVEELARIMREADAAMRSEEGRSRSRTAYYWRDLAATVLAATSTDAASSLDTDDLESIRLALKGFPTWFTATEAKIAALILERAASPQEA